MRTQAIDNFSNWLDSTLLSQAIQATNWVIPTVQIFHLLAIAAVMSSVLMVDLRLLGVLGRDESLARVSARFRPVIWWALPILLATGIVLIVSEPIRALANSAFQLKMLLLIAALSVTLAYQVPLGRNPSFWEVTAGAARRASLRSRHCCCGPESCLPVAGLLINSWNADSHMIRMRRFMVSLADRSLREAAHGI